MMMMMIVCVEVAVCAYCGTPVEVREQLLEFSLLLSF